MTQWHIGIIGGSGLYEPGEIENAEEVVVNSMFGEPSSPIVTGKVSGHQFTFLPRHGKDHRLSPSQVNYRANIDALKRLGVTDILAISAVGSLREAIAPGELVIIDQFIDRTLACRERSFFERGVVAHVPLADPVCSRLSDFAAQAVRIGGGEPRPKTCYVAIEGPQFSTRSESRLYRQWGGDIIGMTGMPEARLAREAELPYALIGMVTDYDCWREDSDVDVTDILEIMRSNADRARQVITGFASILPNDRAPSPIDTVLDSAMLTPPERWSEQQCLALDAIARRYRAAYPS